MYNNNCEYFEVDGSRCEDGDFEPSGMVFCEKEDPTFKGFDCEGCSSFSPSKTTYTVATEGANDFPF